MTIKIRFRAVVIIIALSLCIMPIISYLNSGNSILAHAIPTSVAIDSNDVAISITPNGTTLSEHNSLRFQVELTNTLPGSVFEIKIDTNQSSSLINLSSSIDLTSNISDIAPSSTYSFDIYAKLKENITTLPVDLLIIIDASGSMESEIDSVKAKINTLTSSLSQEIPNLRMGVIVYGWSGGGSPYPANPGNQLQFTSDFNAVHTFINSLYASGSLEPWGDALNVANTYDWRPVSQKLIIMVGDEDCDPGNLVGRGETGDYYNGSELLNEVQNLKDKGVIINTVVTNNPGENVENQFGWISRFTNGESVYLPDFETQGSDLPDLIEKWTLELNREFFQELNLSISWQNLTSGQFSNSEISTFWLDLASPSIIVSEYVKTIGVNLHDVEILATVSDFSNISSVILYHNGSGPSFIPMTSLPNSSNFLAEVKNLPGGTNLTYLIEASDIFGNNGQTQDMWLIVETPKMSVGEKTTIWAESDDQICSEIEFEQNAIHYLIVSGPVDINSMIVNLLYPGSSNQQTPSIIYTQNVSSTVWRKIIPTVYSSGVHFLNMTIPQDKGIFSLSFVWITLTDMDGSSSNVFTDNMTEEIRVKGLEWSAGKGLYFSITFDFATPLVAFGEIYNTDWVYLGQFSAISSFSISENETYYVLIWATLRTGEYSIHLDTDPLENTDPYYMYQNGGAPGFEVYIGILAIFCLYQLFKRTGKRKNH